MKNKKVFPTLLLAVSLATSLGGFLAGNKNVYRKVDAAVTYKTVYLYAPNKVADYYDQENESKKIVWDTNDNDVLIHTWSDDSMHVMNKISTHLYSYTISSSDNTFYFQTTYEGNIYRNSHKDAPFTYGNLTSNKYLLTLSTYGYNANRPHQYAGTWSTPISVINDAGLFASAFLATLGNGICDRDGVLTDTAKLSAVWGEFKTLYEDEGMPAAAKTSLHDATINEEGTTLQKFAALYNYICWKYGYNNFVGRSITPLASVSKYNPVTTDSNSTKNIVIVASISGVSISIVGLYFFLRKRKEDK